MRRTWVWLAAALMAASPLACDQRGKAAPVELAPYMTRLQRYKQRLGFAIEAKNQKLAAYYLKEIDETSETISLKVPVLDGQPIAENMKSFLEPAISPLERSLKAGDWAATAGAYQTLVERCNACHVQTRHEFIVVLPASGEPPRGQRFSP